MTPAEFVNSLRPGNVVNVSWDPPFWNPLRIVHFFIRWYQKRKWGKDSNYKDVHTTLYLGDGYQFSVTVPTAVVELIKPIRNATYTVSNLKTAQGEIYKFTQKDIDIMYRYISKLTNRSYDYGQLVDILLWELFPVFEKKKLSIFDLGKKKKVCSVGVHATLVYFWRETGKFLPRPLGDQYVEITCPADFVNHDTFEIVNIAKIF